MSNVAGHFDREQSQLLLLSMPVGALFTPGFALVFQLACPDQWTPMWPHVALGMLFLGGWGLLLAQEWTHLITELSYASLLLLLGLLVFLLVANDFSSERSLGVLLTHTAGTVVFLRQRMQLFLHGYLLALLGAAMVWSNGPAELEPALLLCAVGATAAFGGIAVRRRTQTLHALAKRETELLEARTTLEERVLARTHALEDEVRERRIAERRASDASRAKSQFLAMMSHELRTPLNAIIGYGELVREDLQDGMAPEIGDVDRILGSGSHLLAMINDILDLSKVEAGTYDLEFRSADLRYVVESVVDSVAPMVEARGNRMVVVVPDELPPLWTDETRLAQVLTNLLTNAAKFTENGTVSLEVERTEDERCRVRVRDTGVGIPPDQLARIFDRFVQVDESPTRRHEGSGLGLAICQELTQALGGEIIVDSGVSQGSTFTVVLPWLATDRASRLSPGPSPARAA